MSDQPDPIEGPLLKVADSVGALIEFWGFKRAMGRMWAILYLSPGPLAAQDLAERLTMSAGAVSMTLAELVKWGVVKKAWRPGDRRDYYEPETSFWKMISRVFRERELQQVRQAIEDFDAALKTIAAASKTSRPDEKKRLRFAAERLESLLGLARIGEGLLAAILAGQRVDPSPITKFFGG